ncbi:peroxiredoxin [Actinocrinis puniceicyclus]|uniref:Peroxiredoxin n=1 Tax=Actinocrinis puniceicyclus TaxID=977794 RepID=A0A8J7WUF1_9ACTN|nr:peroxiredoxin [Actinocrinis puniceicyclus]MBS2966329.1 peroxiredoxin [Actinocrinis puniceicyclus]
MSVIERDVPDEQVVRGVGLPRLGEPAPDFEAVTTHGVLRLADYEGGWLVLFSHPADFTPVCTTEFIGFAEIYPQLRERGTELLGLSIDSVYSHIAWVRNIQEKTGVAIPFPVIADLDRKVATAYGMVMPGESATETARCVFVIDPRAVVRAMIYYPPTTGRNLQEIVRLIDALQAADTHHVATPAGWRPGERVIVPAPATTEQAAERVAESDAGEYECIDWYLCTKKV